VNVPAQGDDPAGSARAHGAALIDLGRPAEALAHLRKAVAQDPGDSLAHCLIAHAQLQLNKPREALEAATAAAAADPENATPHRLMAIAFAKLGRKPQAKAAALEACRLDPHEPLAHIVLSAALQTTGDEAGALAAARHAVELDPAMGDAHNQVGLIMLAHRRLPEAQAAFRAALALNPEHPQAINNLAVVYQRWGYQGTALEGFENAAKLDPRFTTARQNVLKIGGASRKARRLAVVGGLFGALGLATGTYGLAVVFIPYAAIFAYVRWSRMQSLDPATRTLVRDDERARRFHPTGCDWDWLTKPQRWWWVRLLTGATNYPIRVPEPPARQTEPQATPANSTANGTSTRLRETRKRRSRRRAGHGAAGGGQAASRPQESDAESSFTRFVKQTSASALGPATVVLGINVAILALAAAVGNTGWVIIMAVGLPVSSWRFYRVWNRQRPRKDSWRPHNPDGDSY
jgi:Flp pilus assembly protein TadD